LQDAFACATRACPEVTRDLHLGRLKVRLRFAGPALVEPLTAALEHLAAEPFARSDLEALIWDTASTGIDLPRPPWPGGPVIRNYVPGYSQDEVRAGLDPLFGGFSWYDHRAGRALYHLPAASALPVHETAFPLRTLWNWWLSGHGTQVVHAGAVSDGRGAVLLAGAGGSGKSNTSLACLEAGLEYLGDDYVAVEPGPPSVVHTLFASAKLFPSDLEHFPGLAAGVRPAGPGVDAKTVLFPGRTRPASVPRARPLRAILLPQVVRADRTEIAPVSGAQALRAMSPSTMFQLPGAGAAEFRAMAALTRHTPAFALRLGRDRREVVDRIRRFLAEGA
jgi:hypothetical protein